VALAWPWVLKVLGLGLEVSDLGLMTCGHINIAERKGKWKRKGRERERRWRERKEYNKVPPLLVKVTQMALPPNGLVK